MSDEQVDTLMAGKGMYMTFLRNQPYLSTVHISGAPDADVMDVPPHWHETHDEIVRIVKGRMTISLNSFVKEYGPEDGEIMIARRVVHTLKTKKGVECIFVEKTNPWDGDKELFFRNLMETPATNIFELMQICYHGDTRPGLPGHFIWFERALVNVIGGYLAPMLGYKVKHENFPKRD